MYDRKAERVSEKVSVHRLRPIPHPLQQALRQIFVYRIFRVWHLASIPAKPIFRPCTTFRFEQPNTDINDLRLPVVVSVEHGSAAFGTKFPMNAGRGIIVRKCSQACVGRQRQGAAVQAEDVLLRKVDPAYELKACHKPAGCTGVILSQVLIAGASEPPFSSLVVAWRVF